MTLTSIPIWMMQYSTAPKGCVHRIIVTMKVKGSQSTYEVFARGLWSTLSALQCNRLEKVFFIIFKIMLINRVFFCRIADALILWNKRCTPTSVLPQPSYSKSHVINSAQLVLSRVCGYALPISRTFRSLIWIDWKMIRNGSQIHIWPSVFCKFSSLLFFLHLNETGTVIEIVSVETFGGTWGSSFWTRYFGHSCLKTQKGMTQSLEPRSICWNTISL